MLGSYHAGTPWCREPGSAGGFIVTDDPDGLYERALRRKADVVAPPTDTDYGAREFVVRDPEGNLWCFGTYAGA